VNPISLLHASGVFDMWLHTEDKRSKCLSIGLCLMSCDLHVILLDHGYGLMFSVMILWMNAHMHSVHLRCNVKLLSRSVRQFVFSGCLWAPSLDVCAPMCVVVCNFWYSALYYFMFGYYYLCLEFIWPNFMTKNGE
jgi:hypothetical protein